MDMTTQKLVLPGLPRRVDMKNKRYETCKLCKGLYGIGMLVKVPQVGYICPCCRTRAKYGKSLRPAANAGNGSAGTARCIA